jgi:predicted Zn-dependent protease
LLEWSQNIAVALIKQAERMYSHSQGWDWDLAVVGTGELNAWCMAGGKMALYTGLVDATQGNPHKVAAVLGHEIAHALLEHTRTGMSREALLSSSLWIASKSFKIGTGRMNAIAQDLHLGLKSMDRDAEREADALGLELMARAGFDPVEGAKVWLDFQRGEMGTGAKRLEGFLGDHPLDEERLQTLKALAEKLKRTEAPAKAGKKGAQSWAKPSPQWRPCCRTFLPMPRYCRSSAAGSGLHAGAAWPGARPFSCSRPRCWCCSRAGSWI